MELKKTVTSIFLVSSLGIGKERLLDNGYLNGYIKDARRDVQYENAVYLLFKPENLDKFKDFLDEEYERTKQVIDDYDYEDGFVVVVYELEQKFKSDFELVKQGRYSKTSQAFQSLFPKFVQIKTGYRTTEKLSTHYRIFNKTNDLKEYWEEKLNVVFDDDQEYWEGFFEEDETLDLEKLKENV